MDHYLEEFSTKVLPRVEFSIEQAHQMYMNAYHSAGTSAEMTRATDILFEPGWQACVAIMFMRVHWRVKIASFTHAGAGTRNLSRP